MTDVKEIQEDVSKIFYSDIKEKKRTGHNIFKRVSTRKGGANQPLRTPYYFMTNSERKDLNGKVTKYFELMEHEKFSTFDEAKQKEIMENWRKMYNVKDIVKGLNVSESIYYSLLEKLGVATETRRRISQKDLDSLKELDVVDFKMFMSLPTDQRAELFSIYLKNHSVKELSKVWNVTTQRVHNIKYQLKKYMNTEERGNEEKTLYNDVIKHIDSNKIDFLEPITLSDDKKDFYFTLNQDGRGSHIGKKLQMLLSLLEDGESYNLSLTVEKRII